MQLVKYETEKNYATHSDLKGVALLDKINLNCSVGALIFCISGSYFRRLCLFLVPAYVLHIHVFSYIYMFVFGIPCIIRVGTILNTFHKQTFRAKLVESELTEF